MKYGNYNFITPLNKGMINKEYAVTYDLFYLPFKKLDFQEFVDVECSVVEKLNRNNIFTGYSYVYISYLDFNVPGHTYKLTNDVDLSGIVTKCYPGPVTIYGLTSTCINCGTLKSKNQKYEIYAICYDIDIQYIQ